MGRIRTIKPEFLRHEGLQDLEAANPGKYPMLVFAGLWTAADKLGRFEWKPRTLKLDILPFLPFDMAETLALLEGAGHVVRYVVDGKEYGLIPGFKEHQRITGKEAQSPAKYPAPSCEVTDYDQGHAGETPETHPGAQEGKGREEEGNGERAPDVSQQAHPSQLGAVCLLLKSKRIPDVNPGHQELRALVEAGTDIGAFSAAADIAAKAGKFSFPYVLAIVKRQAEEAKRIAAEGLKAPPPAKSAGPPITVPSTAAERTAAEQALQAEHAAKATKPPAEVLARLAQVTQQIKGAA